MSDKEHRNLSDTISKMLDDMEKPWTLKSKIKKDLNKKTVVNKISLREAAKEISLWQKATIEWLADPKHFQPAYLPKMKVPDDGSSMGVYTDKKGYFDTVCRLWIGLTFSDGNAALSPKCRHKTSGKECGMVSILFNQLVLQGIYNGKIHKILNNVVQSTKDIL